MIRKLSSGEFRLYSRKTDPKTGKRKNLGTFKSRAAAEAHERDRKKSPPEECGGQGGVDAGVGQDGSV